MKYRVAAPVTYEDHTGLEKTAWRNVGVAFLDPSGEKKNKVMLNSIPVGAGWDGTLLLFEDEDEGKGSRRRSSAPATKENTSDHTGGRTDFDDDIPF